MHLLELGEIERAARGGSVPEWALGCFRRRSISFFTGAVDEATEVIWMQSRGLTADFRRARGGLGLTSAPDLTLLSLTELLELAEVEGGLARTRWDGQVMSWSDWVSFQTHAKWPEPGRLERVGRCLIEFAPSGAYVEDWRFEPCDGGPLIGLSLIDEIDLETQALRHRGGGLIVCGQHAAFVRGRPTELPAGARLVDFVRSHARDAAALGQVFACDAAYGTRAAPGGEFTVSLATLPWREGQPVIELEGFSYDAARDLIVQRVEAQGRHLERRFAIDTLERELSCDEATVATPEARAWLERERDAILPRAR